MAKQESADKAAQPRKRGRPRKTKPEPKEVIAAPKKRGGRPPLWIELDMKYKLDAVKGWAMQGATMDELAEMLGVATCTLYEWKNKYPEFAEALRAGRHVARGELIAAAFRQSTGYTVPQQTPVKVKRWEWIVNPLDPKESLLKLNEYVETVESLYVVPGNAQIAQFMLKNWIPEQFKDKQEIESYGKEAPTFVDDIPAEE